MNIDQHADLVQRTAAGLTYTVSGGLVLGDALQWLNNNAGAVGAIMAMLTFAVNWYYQHKRGRED
ncbi:HP1 family phage holin [Marinobacterium litorale]|uniref:HP1 family phage holin n=1 Tax=Marinobacterium litorale TaxID=404770 RepID=UPI0003F8130E|nr:HP1 family phage holin [Marinobacterium litorale]